MSISKNALVVEFRCSVWTARKLDREVTRKTNKRYGARDDAGRFNKLLAAKEFTEPYAQIARKARKFHYAQTLPWGRGSSQGLLKAKAFQKYVDQFNEFKTDFDHEVAVFLRHYDKAIEDAQRGLNGMYNPKDYPTRSEIKDKFEMSIKFFPVPEDDFRVNLTPDEIKKLKEEMGVEMKSRLQEAVSDIWKRIKEQLNHMRETLKDKKKGFHDTLFSNLGDIIELLPQLNVTEDKDVDRVCAELKKIMADPDAVKADNKLRAQKAAEVQQVLNKFDSYFKAV